MHNDRWLTNLDPFTPDSVKNRNAGGIRPSVAALVELVDTTDPDFPAIAAMLADMVAAGVEINVEAIGIAAKLAKLQRSRDAAAVAAGNPAFTATPQRLWGEQKGRPSIVYYIRRGDLIKIGTTIRPEKRFRSLLPDEILAWEPGGVAEETQRHRQFRHLRCGEGEYFRITRELVNHCNKIRKIHGDPHPDWPTAPTVAKRSRTSPLPFEIPAPTSPDLVNASEAAAILGIKRSTIGVWIHRKRLRPVAKDDRQRDLYHLDHVRFLRERSKAYSETL